MARIIKLTNEAKEEAKKKFEEALNKVGNVNGSLTYTENFKNDRKATVFFTADAWTKMVALIHHFDSEVAWHGIAYRSEDDEKDIYLISDILVYPQEVTGVTVNTDQDKYQEWLMSQPNDVFNNIRMQGHSHVNMQPTPSGVDITHQEKIIEQLEGDMFYIFMIWNKKFNYTARIYDMKKNLFFDTEDVSVKLIDGGAGLDEFIKGASDMVVKKTYATYSGASSYSGTSYNPATQKPSDIKCATTTTSYAAGSNAASGSKKPGNVGSEDSGLQSRPKSCIGAGWRGRDYGYYGD